jgi:glycosyltransferase involved in cell wall biosynthesis
MTVSSGRIVFVLKGYPRLSETFIAQEIRTLERLGLDLHIVALRRPTDAAIHPVHREIAAPVGYLPEYLHEEPFRVVRGLVRVFGRPGFRRALAAFWRDLRREPTRNRIRRLGQAAVMAAELPGGVTGLHAHFMHTPASVVRYASMITGLPYTCSAHAKDIWTSADWDLAQKLAEADWTVTCTRAGLVRLHALAARREKVHLVYHGLDLARFPPPGRQPATRDGRAESDPVLLLTVARAIEKKGLDVVLRALAALPVDLHWQWTHVGGGETGTLKALADQLGIGARCRFLGALPQADVLAQYRASDMFVLPCRIAADGDRDGLPNVLVEAGSQSLPLLSTQLDSVQELIEDGTHGILVPPDDPVALRDAMARLIADPALRQRLGRAAEARVRRHFDHAATIGVLHALLTPVATAERAAA